MAYRLLHKKSNQLGKMPTESQIEYGELAINYNSDAPKLYIKGSENNVISFISEERIEELVNAKQDVAVILLYEELLYLINNNGLILGQTYRITDYITTTSQIDTISANYPFDIIVEATSTNTLSENAKAVQSDRDGGYFDNNKLESWEIKYCVTNDTNHFAWAGDANGKGVIYYMKDEFNNEAYYDFKNIKFSCEIFESYPFTNAYTFSDINGNDLSLTSAHDNIIKPYISNGKQILNHTIFIGNNVHSNTLKENNYKNIIWIDGCYYNNIGNSFQENYIASQNSGSLISFHNNTIGNLFKKNRIKETFNRNYIGNTTTSCDFFAPFVFNEIGNNSWHIDFNYPVSYCKFGSYIQYCIFNNTAQYVPIVEEMKWCTFGDGLEGAQYIPCCQKVTFEDRCLYNNESNWHINDVVLKDGSKLVEALIQEHDDRLYVCRVDDKCSIFKYKDLDTFKENVKLNTIKPIFSNPHLDFDATSNNANCYGYVGNLSDLNVQGDNILINSIGVYVREGSESPNKSTKVWCRLLKFINNEWVIIYQSDKSQSIEGIEPETLFTFTMVSQKDDALIKFNDKIAITYVDSPIADVNTGILLGFKTITKKGGLQNPLNENSTGHPNWCPALVFGYISTASIQNELYLGEFNDINNVYHKLSQNEIYTNTNITRITFKITNNNRTDSNGYVDQFLTGGPYTINGIQYFYTIQVLYWDGATYSRQIAYSKNNSSQITDWVKYIDHDDNGAPILYSKGSETVTINNNQTINGIKTFNNNINISKDNNVKTVISSNIDGGELKVLHNNSSKGFIVRTNNSSENILPLEILTTNGEDSYQYNFPKTNGNVTVGIKINENIYNAEIINGLIDLSDIFNNLSTIINDLSTIINNNERVTAKALTDLNNRLLYLEK